MGRRLLSAALGVPLLVAAVVVDSLLFAAVVALAAGLGAWEFYRLARRGGARPLSRMGVVFVVLLALTPEIVRRVGLSFGPTPLAVLGWVLPLSVMLTLAAYTLPWNHPGSKEAKSAPAANSGLSQAATDWAWTLAGILYLGLLLSYWVSLRLADPRGYLVLVALFATFAADTFAFFVGRLWGRRHLAPQISPGKTWEGAGGGWVAAVAAAALLGPWLAPQLLTPLTGGILGGLVGVVGPVGDLAESLIKRSVGAKDSGAIIPGHGGILDRLDSLLFTGPVVYFYVSLLMTRSLLSG